MLGCREAGRAHARVGLAVLGMRLEDAFRGGRCLVKAARLVCTSWDVRTLLCAHSCRAEGLAVRLLRACVARVAWWAGSCQKGPSTGDLPPARRGL